MTRLSALPIVLAGAALGSACEQLRAPSTGPPFYVAPAAPVPGATVEFIVPAGTLIPGDVGVVFVGRPSGSGQVVGCAGTNVYPIQSAHVVGLGEAKAFPIITTSQETPVPVGTRVGPPIRLAGQCIANDTAYDKRDGVVQ